MDANGAPCHVRWTNSVEEIPNESTTAHVPSAYDGRVHIRRQRALTPRTPPLHSSDTDFINESDVDDAQRGRSQVRTRILIPVRHRIVSLAASCRRRHRPQTMDLASTGAQSSSKIDDAAESIPDAEYQQLFEAPAVESVSTLVSERMIPEDSAGIISLPYSAHSSQSSNSSHSSSFETRLPPAKSIMLKSNPFDRSSRTSRISVSGGFKAHRDTFALLRLPKKRQEASSPCSSSRSSSSSFHAHLSPSLHGCIAFAESYIDHQTYLALRLTSRSLSYDITIARRPRFPAVYSLPREIIQELYGYLSPFDFDSSRRVCHAWMAASMDKRLLREMLQRGGWGPSIREFIRSCGEEAQKISAFLTRECALSTFWTGYGEPKTSIQDHRELHERDGVNERPNRNHLFELVLETAFSGLCEKRAQISKTDEYTEQNECPIRFTASVCSRFLLVTNESRIHVYRLGKGTPNNLPSPALSRDHSSATLKSINSRSRTVSTTSTVCSVCRDGPAQISPVTSIICPRRVLSVSMDTSSGRYAIASLLEDRMGLVCDLLAMGASRTEVSPEPSQTGLTRADTYPVIETQWSNQTDPGTLAAVKTPPTTSYAPANILFGSDAPADSSVRLPGHSHSAILTRITRPIPLETGPRSIYRSLGSDEDPAISVAICPERRCVAFGCASGIELHWVDALTGQDFNRWFPQPAPSDFLYFLPSKSGGGNAKKLKLVSSAGTSIPRGTIRSSSKSRFGRSGHSKSYSAINFEPSSIWSTQSHLSERFQSGQQSCSPAPVDNYRAIPLSDGCHMVFIDPESGQICIGTDAPLGGPAKLFRRVLLQGPLHGALPEVYSAGAELKQGARIVVGFGEEIWLFSIPRAIFECETSGLEETWAPYYVDLHAAQEMKSVWPLKLRGRYVATVKGLTELAIDTRSMSGLTIWAFGEEEVARAWQIKGRGEREVRKEYVGRDGALHKVI